ncbi:MAG: PTS sugar transporter subunit IIA [Verrucomicrobia bacterium]|nr:PTS sugar transporter subunit IIA [Verrucomicrobiota bacterium]
MPHRTFSAEEVAAYLHLSRPDVDSLVKDGAIPFEKRGERVVFRRSDIDAWASQRILSLKEKRLAEYHLRSSQGARQVFANEAIMPEMVQPDFIAPAMRGKTRASILREMVALAEKTGRLCDPRDLLQSLEAREGLCSTALPEGFALLHPRHHEPYMFASSFIVVGRPIQEIHFGAPDGRPTNLFFLICCQDDRIHLHTLARLCMMAMKTEVLPRLRAAPDALAMFDVIVASEQEVLEGKRHPTP